MNEKNAVFNSDCPLIVILIRVFRHKLGESVAEFARNFYNIINIIQYSYLIKRRRATVSLLSVIHKEELRDRMVWGKGKIRESVFLTKLSGVGLLVTSLCGLYTLDKDVSLEQTLAEKQGKIPPSVITQIQETKNDMLDGAWGALVGEGVAAASLGYLSGRRAKKPRENGPSR